MPTDYEISQMLDFLYKEILAVSELKEVQGEYWGKINNNWVQLFFKDDDEPEYKMADNFIPTDIFVGGERMYVERCA